MESSLHKSAAVHLHSIGELTTHRYAAILTVLACGPLSPFSSTNIT